MFENINEVSVFVSALLAVAIGSIWYSPLLFGKIWMKSVALNAEDVDMPKREMVSAVVRGVIAQTIFFYGIAQFTTYTYTSIISITQVGIMLSLVFCAQVASSAVWERRTFVYVLINAGYMAVIIFGGLAVISYWPW